MKYISTRNNNTFIDFERVSLKGLASDGGLYLPKDWSRTKTLNLAKKKYFLKI